MPPKRAGSKSASSSASSSSSSSSSSNSSSSSSSSGSDDSSSDSDSSNSQDSKKSSTNSSHSSSSADEKSKKKSKKVPSRRPSTNALPTTRTTRSSASSASESESPKKAKKSGASAPKTEVKPTKVAPKKSAAAKVKGDLILHRKYFFSRHISCYVSLLRCKSLIFDGFPKQNVNIIHWCHYRWRQKGQTKCFRRRFRLWSIRRLFSGKHGCQSTTSKKGCHGSLILTRISSFSFSKTIVYTNDLVCDEKYKFSNWYNNQSIK